MKMLKQNFKQKQSQILGLKANDEFSVGSKIAQIENSAYLPIYENHNFM